MKSKENLSTELKFRVTAEQKKIIEQSAKQESLSVSDILRKAIFENNNTSSYALKIQSNLQNNRLYNNINSMKIPKKIKESILKELINCE